MNNIDNQEYKTALPGYFSLTELAFYCGYADTSVLRRNCINNKIEAYKVAKTWLVPYFVGINIIKNKL